jgi:hypothetical protein
LFSGGWIAPFQLFSFVSFSFFFTLVPYIPQPYHQSSKWRRLLSDFEVVPQVNEEASINIIYLCLFRFFHSLSGKRERETHKYKHKKRILLWYIGVVAHSL